MVNDKFEMILKKQSLLNFRYPGITYRGWGKPDNTSTWIFGIPTRIQTWHPLNISAELYSYSKLPDDIWQRYRHNEHTLKWQKILKALRSTTPQTGHSKEPHISITITSSSSCWGFMSHWASPFIIPAVYHSIHSNIYSCERMITFSTDRSFEMAGTGQSRL